MAGTNGDREAVEALYFSLLSSWNDRDAAAWGSNFTEDGSLVGFDGSPIESRRAITAHLDEIFRDHVPAAYVGKVREVRRLTAGAALLRAVAGMVPPDSEHLKAELNTIHLLVAVHEDGVWRAAHLQSTPAAFDGRPDAVDALTDELELVLSTHTTVMANHADA